MIIFFKCTAAYWFIVNITNDDITDIFYFIKLCIEGMLDADCVLITTTNGEVIEITNEKDAGDDIKIYKGIITPGFINAHCHLELSHMKGLIPEKTGLVDFVFKVVNERHSPEEEIFEAINKAEKMSQEN